MVARPGLQEHMKVPPTGKLIDIGGRRIHVNASGRGACVVLFESGIAATCLNWTIVARGVSEFARVITYDRAGFGWSDPAPHHCTALDAAQDLNAVLDALDIREPIIIVAHSFGGLIARIFQQKHPKRVAGLILVDPVVRAEWQELTPRLAHGVRLSRRGATLARMGVVRLGLKLLMSGSRSIPKLMARASAGRGASVTERLTGEVRKMPQELWPAIAWHWSQPKSFQSMADSLENLPVSVGQLDQTRGLGDLPIIILSAGSANGVTLAEHDHDARLSTHGEHIVVPNTGHWIQLDTPEVMVESVRRVCTGFTL